MIQTSVTNNNITTMTQIMEMNTTVGNKRESEDQRRIRMEKKREQQRERQRKKRNAESLEDRSKRLEAMKIYEKKRRNKETEEARAHRLEVMKNYEKKRRNEETEEARTHRLEAMKNYEKKRRNEETPEARAARLARLKKNNNDRIVRLSRGSVGSIENSRTWASNQVTLYPTTVQSSPRATRNLRPAPFMKHEWFENTALATARVKSNLYYVESQLNKPQANACSIEQLALMNNKLQEILSSSINSLIQIRKNLRAEFIADIKNFRFPPSPPVDSIIVHLSPNTPKINQCSPPQRSEKNNLRKATPTRVTINDNKDSTTTTDLTFSTTSRVYLQVKSFSQLQRVRSDCITIPDEPPPKDGEPEVIVGHNIALQVEKHPLAHDL